MGGRRRGWSCESRGTTSEWEQVAAGLSEFEEGWNLRIPETVAVLRERLARTPLDVPVQRQVVAVEGGEVVGGCELHEGARLQTLVVEELPLVLRALTAVTRTLPSDGVIRAVAAARLWYRPGRLDVGRALWHTPGRFPRTSATR